MVARTRCGETSESGVSTRRSWKIVNAGWLSLSYSVVACAIALMSRSSPAPGRSCSTTYASQIDPPRTMTATIARLATTA